MLKSFVFDNLKEKELIIMFHSFNPSPTKKHIGDCVIRALCAVLNQDWDTVYCGLAYQGYVLKDLPSSNAVWAHYLTKKGFKRYFLDNYPLYYTVADFAADHPKGRYVLGTGTHAVAIIDGDIWDSWHSEHEIPIYYFSKN